MCAPLIQSATGPDFADVVFEDVEGYVFRGNALGTILFDIELVDPIPIYRAAESCDEGESTAEAVGKIDHAGYHLRCVVPMTSRRVIGTILLLVLAACSVDMPTLDDLAPGLSGRVSDSVSGRPVVDARVTVQNKFTTSDTNGNYHIGELQAGTSLARVTHPAYRDAERQVQINVLLSPGDFVLEPR